MDEKLGTVNDDVANDYLVTRQFAHEMDSSAMKAYLKYGGDLSLSTDNGKQNQAPTAKQPETVGNEELNSEIKAGDTAGLEQPWLDPVMAASGGMGGSLAFGVNAGIGLLPTLGRVMVSGGAAALMDYPIGAATEAVGEEYPKLALPFNIVSGMVSGMTIERTVENVVTKALARGAVKPGAKAVTAATKKVQKALSSGKATDEISGEAIEVINKEVEKLPLDKALGDSTRPLVELASETETKTNRFLYTDKDLPDKYAINVNINRIDTTDDILEVIAKTADMFSDGIDQARRGVRSMEETKKAASMLGMTPEALLKRRKGEAFNAEEALAARKILVASAENLVGLAKKVGSLGTSDLERFEFRKALNTHYAIQAQVSGMTAEAGRALQSFNILSKNTKVQTKQIQELLKNIEGNVPTEKIAEALSTMDTAEGVTKFTQDLNKATTMDMFLEAWINGLLSGPQTHAVNTLSNTLTAVWQIPERFTAAMFGRIGGGRAISEQEAIAQAFGLVQGFTDGLRSAKRVMQTGETSDIFSKLEQNIEGAITAKNVQELPIFKTLAPNALEEGGVAARAVDLAGKIIRTPGQLLVAEDELFKSIGYRMELNARAFRTAIDEGLEGEAASRRINEILADPQTQAPDVHLAAIDAARYQTFTKPLGRAGAGISQILDAIPALRFIVPFVRTPTNILKFAGERTPLAWVSKNVRAEITAGGARRDLALAKMSLGSMTMATVTGLAAAGHITGGGPNDPEEQAALRRQGWQPYSIRLGDKYYGTNRLEPVGMVFGLASDFAEISGLAGPEMQPEIDDLAAAIVAAISKNVTSKTWLRGVADAVEVLNDQERYAGRYIERFAASFVPSVVAQTERTIDPELEAVYGAVQAMKARIPGLSADMPKRRTLWGEQVTTAIDGKRSWVEVAYGIASPIYISKAKESPIDDELIRLSKTVGMSVRMPRETMSFHGVPVKLEPKEFDRFMVLMNKTKLDSTGTTLKESLNNLVENDSEYKASKDEIKELRIKSMMAEAKKLASEKLIEENKILQYLIEEGQKAKEQAFQ